MGARQGFGGARWCQAMLIYSPGSGWAACTWTKRTELPAVLSAISSALGSHRLVV